MNCLWQTVTNLKSLTPSGKKLFETILLTMLGVLMFVSQVVMAPLPNIEIVSLLIIIIARSFGFKSFISVYIFVLCEVLLYGINDWVIMYMYVWAIFAFVIICIRKIDSTAVYALVSGIYGLLFGTLCSLVYFVVGGAEAGISYIIAGLRFDLYHMAGNIAAVVILYRPLTKAFNKIKNSYGI